MARMKDRQTSPPGGWQWVESQTGWQPPSYASFDTVVTMLIDHRRANPFIVKQHNLPMDGEAVADQVDQYNAERMRTNPNWVHFLSDASPGGQWLPRRLSRSAGAVVEKAKKTVAGIKVVSDWLGEGLRPVEQALAEKRAVRCVECPQNQDPNFIQKFETAVAEKIKKLAEIKNDMKLTTPQDNQLHMCQVCECVMATKVWVPIKHISNETSTETLNKLSAVKTKSGAGCWVPEEIAAAK